MASFADLASTLDKVSKTSGRNEKVRLLAEYMGGLGEEDAERTARFATGRASIKGSADETQAGYSTIISVVQEATGISDRDVSSTYVKFGDLGKLVEEVISRKKEAVLFQEEPLSLKDVDDLFTVMTQSKGKGSTSVKRGHLKAALLRATPAEAKYLVKILTKEMRIGLVDGLVVEAIARAYGEDPEEVRSAYLLLGDVGLVARRAAAHSLSGVRLELMRPTNFMLAEPMQTAREVADYFKKEVYAEVKYDGVRAQLHKRGEGVRIFSRRLEDVTLSFPEVVERARRYRGDLILDGEIVPFRDGRPLAFQMLQRRLRKIEGFEEAQANAPVTYFVFDILMENGAELYARPLRERRARLGEVSRETGFPLAEMSLVTRVEQVQKAFRRSRERGYEGLVLKDPDSPYTPGKRGKFWAKLKEELDTLDVVLVGAELGHGKRAGRLSDYTFAVRSGESFKVIGKAYSGLTDQEIEEMAVKIKAATLHDDGYYRQLRPELVIEVAFDSIQRSDRHDSGFALRFPRIKRLRPDKSPGQVDTIERVKEIYDSQMVRSEP
ncbi:MAG TPA: ATP-dependent DNA ligase [Nitrososphaerales archaeon]|nr:ATP-dependent DNA ligase [Nitrososphaerales archaeon]